MELSIREVLARVTTVRDMVRAFQDEDHCRLLLEAMVWPSGRICPACGYRRSIALIGRHSRKRARPGLYQCSSGTCRFQFTVTTRTPLHATKLPLRVWLSGLWLMLQSDKGISSIRLAEALGVSQPTAWRMGHALRLMVGREQALDGMVEIDGLYVGGKPRRDRNDSPPGRGRKGEPKTLKTPALVAVQRPPDVSVGAPSGEVRAAVIEDLSVSEADRVLTETVDPNAHLMSDEWKAFVSLGSAFAAHDTVHHKAREDARGIRCTSTRRRASMTGSVAPSQVCSTTSARITRISTSMRLAFAGRSGSSQARRRDARARDDRSPRPYGREYRLPYSSQRCFTLLLDARCGGPKPVGLTFSRK
jgi:transposase-like protein